MREIIRNFLHILSLKDLKFTKINLTDFFLKREIDFSINLPRFLYKEIGKNYYWRDRLAWDDKDWLSLISQKNYQLYILRNQSNLAGYYEILIDDNLNFEIAYLGIFKEFFGKKIGAYLLANAIENCFRQGAKRAWVHTCTLDHPNALKNYIARGMTIFKTEKIFFNPKNL